MSIHISCDMYLRLGPQIRLYYVLPYKAKVSAHHGIGFILYRCIVYLGLTMPNLQKKSLLIFEIFNIKKCTFFFFGTELGYIFCMSKDKLHHISVDCSTKRILEFHRWVTSFLVLDITQFLLPSFLPEHGPYTKGKAIVLETKLCLPVIVLTVTIIGETA